MAIDLSLSNQLKLLLPWSAMAKQTTIAKIEETSDRHG